MNLEAGRWIWNNLNGNGPLRPEICFENAAAAGAGAGGLRRNIGPVLCIGGAGALRRNDHECFKPETPGNQREFVLSVQPDGKAGIGAKKTK